MPPSSGWRAESSTTANASGTNSAAAAMTHTTSALGPAAAAVASQRRPTIVTMKNLMTSPRPIAGLRPVLGAVSGTAGDFKEASCQRGSLALVFVLEEYEGFFPFLRAHAREPDRELRVVVVRPPQPEIAPAGGRDQRRLGLLGVGEAQGGAVRAQRLVDLGVVPGVVAKFERGGDRPEASEELAQARHILLEERRQLEQQRSALRSERRGCLEQESHRIIDVV